MYAAILVVRARGNLIGARILTTAACLSIDRSSRTFCQAEPCATLSLVRRFNHQQRFLFSGPTQLYDYESTYGSITWCDSGGLCRVPNGLYRYPELPLRYLLDQSL